MKSRHHIVVFGANGKVGRLVTQHALDDGYAVTAFVHRHHNLSDHPRLTITRGDVHNPEDIKKALEGTDVVVSTLGSWGTRQKDILSAAMHNIIPVMQKKEIKRIISLTGAEARAKGDSLSIIHRLAHFGIGIIGGKVLRDGERHIELLEKSGLDWTVIRSPIMRSGTSTQYHLPNRRPLPWILINRRAVARAVADQIDKKHDAGALYIT